MIDTHTHVIAPDQEQYPLSPRSLSGEWYKEAPHSAEQLLGCMDACGVAQAVLVQAVGAYSYENGYAADSAASRPSRFVSAACIDVEAEDAPAQLRYWAEERGMQGVRLFALSQAGPSWLAEPRTFSVWKTASSLGLHVIVTILSHQLPELEQALEVFPEIPVSLDHCGFPPIEGPPWNEADPLFALARFENLHCKISTNVLDAASKGGTPPSGFVERMAAVFGADRLMWGSDFCQTHDRDYRQLVNLAQDAFGTLTASEREACFVETPRRLWPGLRPENDGAQRPPLSL